MSQHLNSEAEIICRRIIVACCNSAIPLNLLDLLRSRVPEHEWFLKAVHFDRTCINLASFTQELETIEQELEHPLHTITHLIVGASEYDFRFNLWDQLLTRLFSLAEISLGADGYRRFCSEWETRDIFPGLDQRRVDCALLVRPFESEIPIFLVEMGKESFGTGVDSHKDYSKLIGLMSLCCRKLSKDLEISGKSAEDARIYGAYIGGSQIQFCVAQPKIDSIGNGIFTIYTHITCPPEWKFDILDASELAIRPEHLYSMVEGEEVEFQSSLGLLDITLRGELNEIPEYYPLAFESQEESSIISLEEGSDLNAPPSVHVPPSSPPQRLYQGIHSKAVLSILKVFAKTVTSRINYLCSARSSRNVLRLPRNFSDDGSDEFIAGSRPSSQGQTPSAARFNEGNGRVEHVNSPSARIAARRTVHHSHNLNEDFYSSSDFDSDSDSNENFDYTIEFEITKHSLHEFRLYNDFLSEFPFYFPKVNHIEQDKNDPGTFYYKFEYMDTLLTDGQPSMLLEYCSFLEGLLIAMRVSLELLNSLQILHDWFKFVHSDISPSNIMFSGVSETWKINDFNQSLPLEESERTPRIAGTERYIAPESLESGIFTPSSDIWSLGRVIYNIFILDLLEYHESNRGSVALNPLLSNSFKEFERLILSMMSNNPKSRPDALSAIKKIFSVISCFENPFPSDFPVYKRIIRLCAG